MNTSAQALLARVVALARRAGQDIMGIYASGFSVETKPDDSPLTQADLSAHRRILAGLRELTPDVPVLSEESSEVPFETRRQWHEFWLVDPLDGTKEFVQRNGEFTVNIALVRDHEPVLGVVHAPARDVIYYGARGEGAWRDDEAGEAVAIRVARLGSGPVRVVGSRSHRGSSLDAFLARIGEYELLTMGSALKFCLVAEGSADVYPRLGPTSEWDTAAAHAVVCGAGGRVCDVSGAPLRYNTKADLLNPSFIVYGDDGRDWIQYL